MVSDKTLNELVGLGMWAGAAIEALGGNGSAETGEPVTATKTLTGKIGIFSGGTNVGAGLFINPSSRAPMPIFGGDGMNLSQVSIVAGSPTLEIVTINGQKALKVTTQAGVSCDLQFLGATDALFNGEIYVAMSGGKQTNAQSIAFYSSPTGAYTPDFVLHNSGNFQDIQPNDFRDQGGVWTHRMGRSQQAITGTITYPFVLNATKLRVYPVGATVGVLYIHAIGIAPQPAKARIAIMSDDGDKSALTQLWMACAHRGLKSTISLIVQDINKAWGPTEPQLKAYISAGNAIVSHGPNVGSTSGNIITNHPEGIAAAIADMEMSRKYIYDNALDVPGALSCYVWPQGVYQSAALNTDLLDAALSAGYTTGRCSSVIAPTVYYNVDAMTKYGRLAMPYIAPFGSTIAITTTANVAAVITAIQNAAAQGSDLTVTFHKIVSDATLDAAMLSTSCRYSDMVSILAAVSAAKLAGTADDVLFTDFAMTAGGYWSKL